MYILGNILDYEKSNYCNTVCVPEYIYIICCILFQLTRPSWLCRNDSVLVSLWRGSGPSARISYVSEFPCVMRLEESKDPDLCLWQGYTDHRYCRCSFSKYKRAGSLLPLAAWASWVCRAELRVPDLGYSWWRGLASISKPVDNYALTKSQRWEGKVRCQERAVVSSLTPEPLWLIIFA